METEITQFLDIVISELKECYPSLRVSLEEKPFQGFCRIHVKNLFERDYEAFNEFHKNLQLKYALPGRPAFALCPDEVIEEYQISMSETMSPATVAADHGDYTKARDCKSLTLEGSGYFQNEDSCRSNISVGNGLEAYGFSDGFVVKMDLNLALAA